MSDPKQYTSPDITVSYHAKRCIHAAECAKRLAVVFDPNKRPWVQPQHAPAQQIADTIDHCPSGALFYTRTDGGTNEQPDPANSGRIAANGPLYLRGDLHLGDAHAHESGTATPETRLALCRCGASQNKPYCDNSHLKATFQTQDPFADAGIVAAEHRQLAESFAEGGAVRITPKPNGSVRLEGALTLTDANGAVVYQGERMSMCRCGASQNKPFCDGTHKNIGFTTETQP
jgi:CDGSH-type Zn-finger protein/uncharacterized Fe-S cluster protein YjdI